MMVCWSQPLAGRPDSQMFLGALAFVAGWRDAAAMPAPKPLTRH